MTSRTVRLYVASVSFLLFVALWAAVAARPWKTSAADPRLAALAEREQILRRQAALVRRITAARAKAASTAMAPRVRVVTLPPLVITRTS